MSKKSPAGPEKPDEEAQPGATIGDQVNADAAVRENLTELTVAKVQELARAEIKSWKKQQDLDAPKLFQPKTWGNRTLGGAIAGALFALGVATYGMINFDQLDIWHTVDDDMEIKALAKGEIDGAFGGDRFRDAIRDGLNVISNEGMAEPDNSLFKLVDRRVKSAPLLTFHGQTNFGEVFSIELSDPACVDRKRKERAKDRLSPYRDLAPALVSGQVQEPPSLTEQCQTEVPLDLKPALNIPFQARFFEDDIEGKKAERHRVSLVLLVEREEVVRPKDGKGEPQKQARQNKARGAALQQPAGLCVVYYPANTSSKFANGIQIEKWEPAPGGFWIADLTDYLVTHKVWGKRPNAPTPMSYLHSIYIGGVLEEEQSKAADQPPGPALCSSVAPVKDQTISVSAIILVNNDLSFRTQ